MKDLETRIGINVGKASREDRGITVYTHNILKEFNQIGPDCNFVLLHCPGSAPDDKLGLDNAELEPLPYSDKHGSLVTIINEQVLSPLHQKGLGLDVVWHPHNRSQLITPVGYVATMHDVLPIAKPELAGKYLNSWQKKVLYLSRTKTAVSADVVITVSDFSRDEIIRHLGVNGDKIVVIHSGIDRDIFKSNRSEEERARIKSTYLLPDRYLLTTGSYAPHKNQCVILDAYNQSSLAKEGVGLVMVGPNDATGYRVGYNQVKEYAQQLGVLDKVRLLPSVPLSDLVVIYSNAEIFATASLYEGFGFTPLEAMACEVPVVVSNTTAIPEVCGNAALYANPRDASAYANHFNALLEDKNMRQRLVRSGLIQVEKFDWQTAAKKTLEVLNLVAMARR